MIFSTRTIYYLDGPLEDVAYVSKPCMPRDLVRVIDELVDVGHLR